MTDQSNYFIYAEYYVNLTTNYKSSISYFLRIFKIMYLTHTSQIFTIHTPK